LDLLFDADRSSFMVDLSANASQDIRRRVKRVFLASSPDAPRRAIGYYSLSAGSLDATALPEAFRRRLPRYPVPVVFLGPLAVAESHQGMGFGSILLADALQRIGQASQVMAVYAVVVDALNDRVAEFYRQFGFIPVPSQPPRAAHGFMGPLGWSPNKPPALPGVI
jgi:GNAT superfamily N-acetyltransferase